MFLAISALFDTRVVVDNSVTGVSRLSISSKKDLQTIINFFSFSNLHPLIGFKKEQYND